jgi:acyl carrier protein
MQSAMDRSAEVESWMVGYLADLLDIPASDVVVTRTFDQYGLDSTATVAFTSDLGRWLGVKLDTRVMLENDSIKAVAEYIRKNHGKAA